MGMLAPQPPPGVRASDADRERITDILRRECAEGRLTPEELSERLDKAFAARTHGDLRELIADLPAGNVNPVAELVTGVVNTGMQAVRIGVVVAVGATVLALAVPLVIGLGIAFGGVGAAIGTGLIVLAILVGARSLRRRRA